MKFAHQSQPLPNVCGQTVVAMVAGCPVDEVITEIGRRKTFPSDLKRALKNRGWSMRPAKIQLPNVPDRPAILRCWAVQNHKIISHWVLWTGREILDPANCQRQRFGPDVAGSFYLIEQATSDGGAANES